MNEDNSAPSLPDFVVALEQLMRRAKALSPHEMARQAAHWVATHPKPALDPSAPVCVIVSPHPDDECIGGGLPLRLMQESGWRVVNIAVTHGSDPNRQIARALELSAACARIGFEPLFLAERGLNHITLQTRDADPPQWAQSVTLLAEKIAALSPTLVLCPHALDAQKTHIGTHHLTLDALAAVSAHSPNTGPR